MPQRIVVNDVYVLRERLRLSQAELARKAGVCRQTYFLIEAGKQDPTPPTFFRLVKALRTTPERLQRGAVAL
jgi:DNA-binding XRE family transcriptional regulator